ncbi:MAG: hypothetical protein BGO59_28610 [Spirosoma sp. 48-14]|nr:MAG: hypothetical protein BGO59_28610 [Spirosoma sp. 48-14]
MPIRFFWADQKLVNVQPDEILYIESLKDYVRIVTRTVKPLLVKQTIGHWKPSYLPTSLCGYVDHLSWQFRRSLVIHPTMLKSLVWSYPSADSIRRMLNGYGVYRTGNYVS